jgi:thiol-disulfide isomerase/thioredoxin
MEYNLNIYMGFLEDRLKAVGDGVSDIGSGWTYKSMTIVIILIAAFLGAAYYTYTTYIQPSMNPTYVTNNEFQTEQGAKDAEGGGIIPVGNKHAQMYLFYTDWCPYSQKVLKPWNEIKSLFNTLINNTEYVIDFIEINGESQAKELEEFQSNYLKDAAKSKIDGYPSIYLVKDERVIEFEAQPSKDTLTEFINAVF